jgi:hypothetical protein
LNSTIVENEARPSGFCCGGGLVGGIVQNTIIAHNIIYGDESDWGGGVSLGNNLIGNPTGSSPLPSDLTGNPNLGPYTDDGTPGNGHFPLLPTSQAINAGNPAACPKKDQLGEKRVGICDIGAIEFQGTAIVSQ